ncbi:hypothetical protein NH602_07915, partial [Pseudonocardia sp. McavD-2-B]|nr:hypothetical protein [Pseudonocardia sp. McavD-2-B]
MNDENRTPRGDDDRPTDRQPPVPADETPTAHTPIPHVRDGVHGGGTVAAASDAGDPARRRRFAALRRRSALPAVAAGVIGLVVGATASGLIVGTAFAGPGDGPAHTAVAADGPGGPDGSGGEAGGP